MKIQEQIEAYIASHPEAKRNDMLALHDLIAKALPECRLWFDNGIDSDGKTVTNPTIGYGFYTIKYADGKTKDFFQIGLSANKTGISVYIMGIEDKTYLPRTFGAALGKAKVTGYCIRFAKLKDINTDILEDAVRYGAEVSSAKPE